MITAIIVVLVALAWLAYETKWFSIRLPVGSIPLPEIPQVYKSWNEIQSDFQRLPPKFKPMWVSCPDNMQPLCGMDWLTSRQHIVPSYKIMFKAWGVTNHITLKVQDDKIIKEVATCALKPYKAQRQALTAQRKAKRLQVAYA